MRSPQRIWPLLEKISVLWLRYPDTRLGQLLSNLTRDGEDIFYIEDEELTARVQEKINDGFS